MEQTIMAIVNKLDPSSLILLLFGFGAWKLSTTAIDKYGTHADKMADSLESIAKDTTMLRVDMAVIANRVNSHETRLDSLENKQ